MVLKSDVDQGHLARNVALFVDMPSLDSKDMQTFTAKEAEKLLRSTASDFLRIAWRFALSGLRRGEIAGLWWDTIDF